MKRSSLSTFAALALLSACTQLPSRPGADVQVLASAGLESQSPADVVIAPVEAVGGKRLPDRALRKGFQRALVKRRYSPLAIDFVDERVVEAAYSPGTLREDAVLQIVVHEWDDSLWDPRTALVVDVEARMLDAAAPDAAPLWAGRLSRRFDLNRDRVRFATEAELLQEACDRIAEEILAAMPVRRTAPGG